MYKQFDSAAARKCPVVISKHVHTQKKKRAKKAWRSLFFFFLRIFSCSCYSFRTADDDSENFVLFGFELDFLILFFLFYVFTKSKPAEDISQHCGAEKKALYCMCDNMYTTFD